MWCRIRDLYNWKFLFWPFCNSLTNFATMRCVGSLETHKQKHWFYFGINQLPCKPYFKLGLWADASHGSTRLTFFNSFIVHWCWFSLSITQIKFCVAISMYCSISNCLAIMHHIQDYFCPQIFGFSEILKKSYVGQIIWNGTVNWYCHRKFISCDTQRESTTMHNKKIKKCKPRTAVQSIGPQTK